ncbi:MAG: hypothetical protein ABTQ34_06630 [Bdellovibrionales bacterium]
MLRFIGALAETSPQKPLGIADLRDQNQDAPVLQALLDTACHLSQTDYAHLHNPRNNSRTYRRTSATSSKPFNLFLTAAGAILANALPKHLLRPAGMQEAEWHCMWSAYIPVLELLPALVEANEADITTWNSRCVSLRPFMAGSDGKAQRYHSSVSNKLTRFQPTAYAVTALRVYQYAGFLEPMPVQRAFGRIGEIIVTDSGKFFAQAIQQARAIAKPFVPPTPLRKSRKKQPVIAAYSQITRVALKNISMP